MGMSLLMVCIASFAAVFVVLVFLALIMKWITHLFPEKVSPEKKKIAAAPAAASEDAAVYAAIASTYAVRFPGTRVSNIEELKESAAAPAAASEDAAVYAAIASTFAVRFPGTRVSNIEELKI